MEKSYIILVPGVDDPHLAVPLELDAVGHAGVGVDQDFGDVSVHRDVEVFPAEN